MTDAEILDLVRGALFEVAPDKDFGGLSLDANLAELGLNSIDTMEMVRILEEQLDREFPDEELAKVQRIRDLGALMLGRPVEG